MTIFFTLATTNTYNMLHNQQSLSRKQLEKNCNVKLIKSNRKYIKNLRRVQLSFWPRASFWRINFFHIFLETEELYSNSIYCETQFSDYSIIDFLWVLPNFSKQSSKCNRSFVQASAIHDFNLLYCLTKWRDVLFSRKTQNQTNISHMSLTITIHSN